MLKYFLLVAVFCSFSVIAQAQETEEQTRDLWDTAFLQKRPVAKKPVKRAKPVRYKVVSKRIAPGSPTPTTQSAVVGVTIWRLRPSKASDDAEVRQLMHQQ